MIISELESSRYVVAMTLNIGTNGLSVADIHKPATCVLQSLDIYIGDDVR